MLQEVFAVLAILGMVIGSGFITGKEIVVFFSRFGVWSFLTIFLSFFLFFFLFKVVLNHADVISEKLKKSKTLTLINLVMCIIFASAMFGGINNLLKFDEKLINFCIFCVILLVCALIFKKGGSFFNKINLFLVPIMIVIFVVLLLSKLKLPQVASYDYGCLSFFYMCLYCLLNVSNGCIVLAGLGRDLSKKQKARVAFISALVLGIMLLLTNIVLLAYPALFNEEMPMLAILSSSSSAVITLVVFIGCLTTLLSIVYSASSSIRGMIENEYLNFALSILLPLILSFWGFSNIVAYLYPLASVMGGVMLFLLFFIPPFKWGDKKIHARCKNAKKENACHNNIKF